MNFPVHFFIILLLTQCITIHAHEVNSNSGGDGTVLKLKSLLWSILDVTTPPLPVQQEETNFVAKVLNDLPSSKVASFNEISMKDIPEKIPPPLSTTTPPAIATTDDSSFMSRLMDLNSKSQKTSKSSVDRNFLDKLMDIFFKRFVNENDDVETKRSELENKDFGSLLYLGKRFGRGSGQRFNYADMYNGNKQSVNELTPPDVVGSPLRSPEQQHIVLQPVNNKFLMNPPLLQQHQQLLNMIRGRQQQQQQQHIRRDVDVDTLKFLADLQI